MAYRQYIGARYVPLFDGPWDATKNYEPLTVVEDGNGNSYTSKKDVPAGTPLTDRNYWMLTASFSGAVEQLRRDVTELQGDVAGVQGDVAGVQGDVAGVQGDVAGLQGDVTGLQGDVTGLQGDVTRLQGDVAAIAEEKILFVSDSYGLYYDENNKNFAQIFTELSGIESEHLTQTGIGFKTSPSNFGTLLASYSGDKTKITEIMIVGGANDIIHSEQSISDGISQVKRQAATFPNLRRLSCFACGVSMYGLVGSTLAQTILHEREYTEALPKFGIVLNDNSLYILQNTTLLRDRVHPNANGLRVMAGEILNFYKSGSCGCNYGIITNFTPTVANVTSVARLVQNRRNDEVILLPAASPLTVSIVGNFTLDAGGNLAKQKIANYDASAIDTYGFGSGVWIPVHIAGSNGSKTVATMGLSFENGEFYITIANGTPNAAVIQIYALSTILKIW